MAIKLFNAVVCQEPGLYEVSAITENEFMETVATNEIESYLGHQAVVDFIKKKTGKDIQLNRGMGTVNVNEKVLVIRLKQRNQNVAKDVQGDDVYEFLTVRRVN